MDDYDKERDDRLDFPPDDEPDPRENPDYWNGAEDAA